MMPKFDVKMVPLEDIEMFSIVSMVRELRNLLSSPKELIGLCRASAIAKGEKNIITNDVGLQNIMIMVMVHNSHQHKIGLFRSGERGCYYTISYTSLDEQDEGTTYFPKTDG